MDQFSGAQPNDARERIIQIRFAQFDVKILVPEGSCNLTKCEAVRVGRKIKILGEPYVMMGSQCHGTDNQGVGLVFFEKSENPFR